MAMHVHKAVLVYYAQTPTKSSTRDAKNGPVFGSVQYLVCLGRQTAAPRPIRSAGPPPDSVARSCSLQTASCRCQ